MTADEPEPILIKGRELSYWIGYLGINALLLMAVSLMLVLAGVGAIRLLGWLAAGL